MDGRTPHSLAPHATKTDPARRRTLTILVALGLAAVALPAQAYLDPASGSMILQLILGGVAGAAVAIKLYWHKLLGLFGVKKEEHDDPAA